MSNTLEKNCPCPSPELVSVPGSQGAVGPAGTNGTNGSNSYSVTTAQFTIPTTGTTVTVQMNTVAWMSVAQSVFVSDGTNFAHFLVTALQQSPPVATLKAKGDNGDTAATNIIANGASVSPTGVQGTAGFTALGTTSAATGGAQAVTATPAQALAAALNLSGTVGKTYMLFARMRLDSVGATFAANQAITLTIRRTNNTAGNLVSTTLATGIITTATVGYEITAAVNYVTVGAADNIQVFCSVSVIPSAGALNIIEASLAAIQLS